MYYRSIFAAAAFLIAVPAMSQADSPAPAPAKIKPAKPKKICRSEAPTGSHFSSRTCLTEQEWAARDANDGASTLHNGGSGLSHGSN